MKDTIYIQLLGEGTIVYRPVPAIHLFNNTYRIGGRGIYILEDEKWEFLPDEIVLVEKKKLESEWVFVAVKKAAKC